MSCVADTKRLVNQSQHGATSNLGSIPPSWLQEARISSSRDPTCTGHGRTRVNFKLFSESLHTWHVLLRPSFMAPGRPDRGLKHLHMWDSTSICC